MAIESLKDYKKSYHHKVFIVHSVSCLQSKQLSYYRRHSIGEPTVGKHSEPESLQEPSEEAEDADGEEDGFKADAP